jgi:hypothetical protein
MAFSRNNDRLFIGEAASGSPPKPAEELPESDAEGGWRIGEA